MRLLLILFFSAGLALGASAQKTKLELKKGQLTAGAGTITTKQALSMMESYPEAYTYMKKANGNRGAAGVFGTLGGGLIGWPVGTAIGGGDPNWGLAAVGAGLIMVALPFNGAFKKNATMAINLYNEADYRALNSDVRLNIGLLERGFGLKISF